SCAAKRTVGSSPISYGNFNSSTDPLGVSAISSNNGNRTDRIFIVPRHVLGRVAAMQQNTSVKWATVQRIGRPFDRQPRSDQAGQLRRWGRGLAVAAMVILTRTKVTPRILIFPVIDTWRPISVHRQLGTFAFSFGCRYT